MPRFPVPVAVLGLCCSIAFAAGSDVRSSSSWSPAAGQSPASASIAPAIDVLLAGYVRQDSSMLPALAGVDLVRARSALERIAPRFLTGTHEAADPIEALVKSGRLAPADAADRRRRVLAAFALDLAGANAVAHSAEACRMVEWACPYIRQHRPADTFDRLWQLAATALLEGALDPPGLEVHLAHINPELRADPRIVLAHALVREQRLAPREVTADAESAIAAAPDAQHAHRDGLAAIEAFEGAAANDAIRTEALVRMAHVQIGLARHAEALKAIARTERDTADPALVFLGRLFRGIALDGLQRRDEARAAWRSALVLSPRAHSATMALAASLFRDGRREEADRLVADLLDDSDPRRDVWWSYWAGDYRFWYRLIDDVRKELR